jgi:site-specific DNA-methyltransferase (adenine-specific)
VRLLRDPRAPLALDDDLLIEGDNERVLELLPVGAFDMAYADPPFNTGRQQRRGDHGYADAFADYEQFLIPRLARVRELLADHGTLYVHLDWREHHYVKVALDAVFGRDCFLNEIVWAYDFGGRPKRRWPAKHDTILVYVKARDAYHFDDDEVDREPYMAPGLVGPEKAARGKRPSDTWWHTIVHTTGREKTGYPTQKPLGILRRMVAASSRPGGWCLDPFAGSGTLGAAAQELGRRFVLIDANPEAVRVAAERLGSRPS